MFLSTRHRKWAPAVRGTYTRSLKGLPLIAFLLLAACADRSDSPDALPKSPEPTNTPTASVSPLHQALLERLHRRDSDYDGRTDVEEYGEGGDPFDPASRRGALLARWRFDDPSLVGERGENPVRRVGAQSLDNPEGGASLWLDPEQQDAAINYRVQELSGKPNINLREGTIRFRFRPDWSSGQGPGNIATLLAVGVWNDETTYPFWGLIFNGSGEQIHFYSNGAGARNHMLEGNVHLTQGQWVTIHLAYSPTHCAVWLDRQLVAERDLEEPPTILALDIANRDGFDLGANRYGGHPAYGAIDDLELYNTPFSPEQTPNISDWGLHARFDPSSTSVRLETPLIPGISYTIERAVVTGPSGRSDFESIATDFPGGVFMDAPVSTETITVYRASARGSVDQDVAAVRESSLNTTSEPLAHRGTLAVITEESLRDPLHSSIDNYLHRAVADGWRIWTTNVSDATVSPSSLIEEIRRARMSMQPQVNDPRQPSVVAVTFLGQLESLATQISELAPSEEPWAISLIDFAAKSADTEAYQLQATTFFDKLNRVSEGSLSFPNRILRDSMERSIPASNGWLPQAHELAISLYGVDPSRVDPGARPPFNYMITTRKSGDIESMSWTLPSGSKTQPRIGVFLGDRFAVDRDDPVYKQLLRELARADSGVAAVSAARASLDFGLLAEGRSLAAARALSHRGVPVTTGLDDPDAFRQPILGDATIRLFAKPAPEKLSATLGENGVRLTWESNGRDMLIERSDDGLAGPFVQLHSGTLESGTWSDAKGVEHSIYRIRYRMTNPYGPGPHPILSYGALAAPSWE